MKRVAIYLRDSTNDQQTDLQKTEVYKYIDTLEARPYLIKHYSEKVTGTGKKNRPVFNQIIADCKAGKYDTILCYSIDRFSRSNIEFMRTCYDLIELGIGIKFIKH